MLNGHAYAVCHLYEVLLGRAPDAMGLLSHCRSIARGRSYRDVARSMISSGEYGGGDVSPDKLDLPSETELRGRFRAGRKIGLNEDIPIDDVGRYEIWAECQDAYAWDTQATHRILFVIDVGSVRDALSSWHQLRRARRSYPRCAAIFVPHSRLAGLIGRVTIGRGRTDRVVESADLAAAISGAPDTDIIVPLRAGDEICVPGLLEALDRHPDMPVVLSDGDDIDSAGHRTKPRLRGGWDPELDPRRAPLGVIAIRAEALRSVQIDTWPDRTRIHGLIGRIAKPHGIAHVASVLYHSVNRGSVDTFSSAVRADEVCAEDRGEAPDSWPAEKSLSSDCAATASIVILSRDSAALLGRCVQTLPVCSLRYEVIIVDNGSSPAYEADAFRRLAPGVPLKVIRCDAPFNWSTLNNFGIRHSRGDVVVLLNDDTFAESDWLTPLVAQAARPTVGIAGAKLLYPDKTIQHAGIAFQAGNAWHVWRHADGDSPGYLDALVTRRSVSAVTGACMAFRRAVYEKAGGLDEDYEVLWSDIDFCLRVRQLAMNIVWSPESVLFHIEQATRGEDGASPHKRVREAAERARFEAIWDTNCQKDPYFSELLNAGSAYRSIAVRRTASELT